MMSMLDSVVLSLTSFKSSIEVAELSKTGLLERHWFSKSSHETGPTYNVIKLEDWCQNSR